VFSIGEFARHGRVSVRMLRHYDAIGLLRPATVDAATGYRFYQAGQLAELNRIIALKDLGFTLGQVQAILAEQVSAAELRGMLKLRRAEIHAQIEAETARLAARAASPAQVTRLREICAEGRAAAEQGDLGRTVAANDAFHAEVAAVAGNAVLAELADIVGRRVQWYYRMVAPERGHGSWAEHAELIDAIEASDPERAQLLARKHTERTRDAYHNS